MGARSSCIVSVCVRTPLVHDALRLSWCIWLALLMTALPLGADVPGGTVGWAPLGIVAGIAFGSRCCAPGEARGRRRAFLRWLVPLAGVALSLACEALAEVTGEPMLGLPCILLVSYTCGWCGCLLFTEAGAEPVRWSAGGVGEELASLRALLGRFLLLGLIQRPAWAAIVPLAWPAPTGADEGWPWAGAASPMIETVLFLTCLAFVCAPLGGVYLVMRRHDECGLLRHIPILAAAFCAGSLVFHVLCPLACLEVGTACPWAPQAALALYAMLSFDVIRKGWGLAVEADAPAQPATSSLTVDELRGVVTSRERARLRDLGLTGREIDVLCAHIWGVSSAQAGALLGISDKTVREYRRRCREKLDVMSLDEVDPAFLAQR